MRSLRMRPPTGAVVVAVLLVTAATAAAFSTLDLRVAERPPPERVRLPPEPTGGAVPGPPRTGQDGSSVPGELLLVLMLLVGSAVAGWLLWRLLRRLGAVRARRWYRLRALRPAAAAPPPESLAERQLLAAVDEAVARSADDDPRRAVIACWVRLAEAAGEVGIPRYRSDTATDLVVRLLRRHRVSEPVLGEFVAAYWLARYATHTVDEQLRGQARSALARLRAELREPARLAVPA